MYEIFLKYQNLCENKFPQLSPKGEVMSLLNELDWNNSEINKIVFEDDHAIVLSKTYTYNHKEEVSTFTTIIDKKRLTFVFVGLEYQNNSAITEGKCKIF